MNDILKIDVIAQGIMAKYYGSTQNCGTHTQRWTYAILQARDIFEGKYKIDKDDLSEEAYKYCKEYELI
jgi:hypothetical protein